MGNRRDEDESQGPEESLPRLHPRACKCHQCREENGVREASMSEG
jgi:hypothetical protein